MRVTQLHTHSCTHKYTYSTKENQLISLAMSTFIQMDKVANYYYPKLFKELVEIKCVGTLLLLHPIQLLGTKFIISLIFYVSVLFFLL